MKKIEMLKKMESMETMTTRTNTLSEIIKREVSKMIDKRNTPYEFKEVSQSVFETAVWEALPEFIKTELRASGFTFGHNMYEFADEDSMFFYKKMVGESTKRFNSSNVIPAANCVGCSYEYFKFPFNNNVLTRAYAKELANTISFM